MVGSANTTEVDSSQAGTALLSRTRWTAEDGLILDTTNDEDDGARFQKGGEQTVPGQCAEKVSTSSPSTEEDLFPGGTARFPLSWEYAAPAEANPLGRTVQDI